MTQMDLSPRTELTTDVSMMNPNTNRTFDNIVETNV